jgi:uncharacterized damage-inducible protein DinB
MATRKDILAADFFQRYLNLISEDDVHKALRKNTKQFTKFLDQIPKKKIEFAYAEGKWTVKQILQHVIDAERVFAYRALSFSRNDASALPGFDENQWSDHAQTKHRKWGDLVKEFRAVRRSTEFLFESFTDDQLLATGTASDHAANALAFGFICAGHAMHHLRVIKERYL